MNILPPFSYHTSHPTITDGERDRCSHVQRGRRWSVFILICFDALLPTSKQFWCKGKVRVDWIVLADEFLAQLEKRQETMFKPSDQPVLAAASRGDIAEMKEILRTVQTAHKSRSHFFYILVLSAR